MNRGHRQDSNPAPRTLAIAGGQRGVGATTIAVNLAVALAQQGQRTVIIDADTRDASVASACGISPASTIAEVLTGKRSIHEALVRGPGGTQIVAGSHSGSVSQRALDRLVEQIAALGRHTDAVVIDLGAAPTELMVRLWREADRLLLIATPQDQSVMDAYALVKTLVVDAESAPLSLVVNRAASELAAQNIHGRIDRSCRRFLNQPIDLGGWLPVVDASGARDSAVWMLRQPVLPASSLVERMALRLCSGQGDSRVDAA